MNQHSAREAALELANKLHAITDWEEFRNTLEDSLQAIEDLSKPKQPVRVYSIALKRTHTGRYSRFATLRFNLAIAIVFFLDVLRSPTTGSRISADIDTGKIKIEPA